MTQITCDTTPADDGYIHAVVFQTVGLPALSDPWTTVAIGTVLDLVDQDTGATTTGTLASYEVSASMPGTPLAAVRVELVITPG